MIVGVGRPEEPSCHRSSLATRRSTPRWLGGIVAGILIAPIFIQLPAQADEFDALAIYSEARPLNDRWQACAASYVRQRLQSQVSSEALASAALEQAPSLLCHQDRKAVCGERDRRSAPALSGRPCRNDQ
jgi:hypothetical protein